MMTEKVSDEDHEQRPNEKETRLKWREQKMKKTYWTAKRKVKGMVFPENSPRNLNGKKRGYMQIMKEFWDETDHAGLNLTS